MPERIDTRHGEAIVRTNQVERQDGLHLVLVAAVSSGRNTR